MVTRSPTTRQIGFWGTTGRVALGGGLLVGAAVAEPTWADVVVGLVAYPAAVIVVLALRGRDAPPLRLSGASGHGLNLAILVPLAVVAPVPWLLFIGSSMVLAARRGDAGCELFTIANWARGRDDQIACPVFHPIDAFEARAVNRMPGT